MSFVPVTNQNSRPRSISTRQVLTVPEAAQVLGISRSLAYTLVSHGEIKAVRLGRRIIVPCHVIDELLGRNAEATRAPDHRLF